MLVVDADKLSDAEKTFRKLVSSIKDPNGLKIHEPPLTSNDIRWIFLGVLSLMFHTNVRASDTIPSLSDYMDHFKQEAR